MTQANMTPTPPSQKARWMTYGTNVAVLILAVIVIVVLVNWMTVRAVPRNAWMRMDFTQSRQYSLSPQTQSVLRNLDRDVTVTLLYARNSEGSELLTRVEDLLTEYASRSNRVKVRTIDPTTEVETYESFIKKLLERYPEQVAKNREAFADVKKLYARIKQFAEEQTTTIPAMMGRFPAEVQAAETGLFLRQVNSYFSRVLSELQTVERNLDELLQSSLPDFRSARTLVASAPLPTSLDEMSRLLKQINGVFEKLVVDAGTPAAVKDALLGLKKDYVELEQEINAASKKLEDMKTEDYDQLRASLAQRNSVVVALDQPASAPPAAADAGKDAKKPADAPAAERKSKLDARGVTVLGLTDIYPNLMLAAMSQGEVPPEQGYKGEEVITGALLRLTLQHKTKVVFVNTMGAPVLMRGAGQLTYTNVADRLEKMNFEVTEWAPGGAAGPFGQRTPPQPPPVAEPGQKMIFVILPTPPPDPRNPSQLPTGPMVAEALKNHLAAGQPAIVFMSPSSLMTLGQPDPIAEPLKDFGVVVQTSRTILTEMPGPGGKPRTINQLEINDFNTASEIGRAVNGLRGIVVQGMPIELPPAAPEGVKQAWLARTSRDTWSSTEGMDPSRAKRGESDPAGPFNIAVSAEKDKTRLIVVGDPAWASDVITTFGRLRNAMTGEALFSEFPANAELFVNSVYWAAGLEELIAPGARSQDVRRIGSIERPAYIAVYWIVLAGVPLLCLVAGGFVWAVRRR